MSESFSVISNLAVTIHIAVDLIPGHIFFSKVSLNLNRVPSPQVDLKTILSLQNGIFFSMLRLKHALKSSKNLPV